MKNRLKAEMARDVGSPMQDNHINAFYILQHQKFHNAMKAECSVNRIPGCLLGNKRESRAEQADRDSTSSLITVYINTLFFLSRSCFRHGGGQCRREVFGKRMSTKPKQRFNGGIGQSRYYDIQMHENPGSPSGGGGSENGDRSCRRKITVRVP